MRVAMITFGSQGDVRPLVALGQGLVRAGHQAVLLADAEFAVLSAEVGMEFIPLAGGSLRDPAKHSEFDALFKRGLDPRVIMRAGCTSTWPETPKPGSAVPRRGAGRQPGRCGRPFLLHRPGGG